MIESPNSGKDGARSPLLARSTFLPFLHRCSYLSFYFLPSFAIRLPFFTLFSSSSSSFILLFSLFPRLWCTTFHFTLSYQIRLIQKLFLLLLLANKTKHMTVQNRDCCSLGKQCSFFCFYLAPNSIKSWLTEGENGWSLSITISIIQSCAERTREKL